MACAPSKDSDPTGRPPSLIRIFTVRMKKAGGLCYPLSAQQRLWSDWVDAQADLSLRWEPHFCSRESCLVKVQIGTEPLLGISAQSSKPSKIQSVNQRLFSRWIYCRGNHWSDQCLEYPSADDSKLKIKLSCFICLEPCHIADKCFSNKRCYYYRRKNHHHRSRCSKKIVSLTEEETAPFDDWGDAYKHSRLLCS